MIARKPIYQCFVFDVAPTKKLREPVLENPLLTSFPLIPRPPQSRSQMQAFKRLIPNTGRLVVQKAAAAATKTGIILPGAEKAANTGVVLAIGAAPEDRFGNKMAACFAVGDSVLLPEHGGIEVKVGKDAADSQFLYRYEDILGKWEQ